MPVYAYEREARRGQREGRERAKREQSVTIVSQIDVNQTEAHMVNCDREGFIVCG